mmetsp:Transcript_30715/g.43586  ORF Transcript_30715/g.43586 Transcript_30715/m.43586 type:complete len:520 (+) Transcript_30715:73-1632(+)|eukprot:CAMPEP_0202470702 /NCGR_PEP_ID=MMETSP1360-20130828/82322_1 /ASSEMBLY_ACC=CAM_ASM_000848 /TAXON_ID=515479 /ORGANISM="Licmophora paradoxa, Strain CCMP2313" /LENGTH=519 /DNA_ID=CAMNT_0049096485 /DNA_START=50 /DNA_END=1609 /DNA_ORIENTATION=-
MFSFAARAIERSEGTTGSSWVEDISVNTGEEREEEGQGGVSVDESSSAHTDDDLSTIQPRTVASSSVSSIEYGEPVVGIPAGTFVEIYRDQMAQLERQAEVDSDNCSLHDRNTIVSSVASERSYAPTMVPRVPQFPRGNLDLVLSSNPQSHVFLENPLSISTTETIYQDLSSLEGNQSKTQEVSNSQDETSSFLSLSPSMMDSSFIHASSNNINNQNSNDTDDDNSAASESELPASSVHDSDAFSNVGNRLASVPEGLQPNTPQGQWFSRFSERDWVRFHNEADMVLSAMVGGEAEGDENYVPPLPPKPPVLKKKNGSPNQRNEPTGRRPYLAHDHLPNNFICSLCDDVLVGAATLDCGCPYSTICYPCWEDKRTSTEDDEELEDCVCIESCSSCPFCERDVSKIIACHALDVAILHCVKALPQDLPIQRGYYERLQKWRLEILRRRTERQTTTDHQTEKDRMLAELIRREEEVIWQKHNRKNKQKHRVAWWQNENAVLVTQAVAIAAAAALVVRFRFF